MHTPVILGGLEYHVYCLAREPLTRVSAESSSKTEDDLLFITNESLRTTTPVQIAQTRPNTADSIIWRRFLFSVFSICGQARVAPASFIMGSSKNVTITSEQRLLQLSAKLHGFPQDGTSWKCPGLNQKGDPCGNSKVTKKHGKDVPGLAAALLAWLEDEDLMESPNVDFDEFIGLVACHQHQKGLTAAITALEKSRVSISDSNACTDSSSENVADFNENPPLKMEQETPVKTRAGFAVSSNSTQDSKYKATPTRPTLTTLQYKQSFVKLESSDSKHSYDSSFWDTPSSTFSEDPLEQFTPETPHSEWLPPRRRHQYFEPPKSPTVRRGTRRRGQVDYRTQYEEEEAQSEEDANPMLTEKNDDNVVSSLVRRQLFRDGNGKADLGSELKKEEAFSVSHHQKDRFTSLTTKQGDYQDAINPEIDMATAKKYDLPVKHGRSDVPICPDPSRDISPGGSLGSVQLELYKENPSAAGVIKVLEKNFGKNDSKVGRVYIIRHRDYISQDPMDDRQLFKVGFTANTTEARYKKDTTCKEIHRSGTIIFQSEKPFKHAFRVESLVHASLAEERMTMVNCPTCNGKHIEWFLSTEERVRKAVEQWTTLLLGDKIYAHGKLTKEFKDYLRGQSDPARILDNMQTSAATQQPHTIGSEGNLRANKDTAILLNTTVESMGNREFESAGKPGTLQWTTTKSNPADSVAIKAHGRDSRIADNYNSLSRYSHETEKKCASAEMMNSVQNNKLNNKQMGKDKTSVSGWNIITNLLKHKTGLKTLKESLKLTTSTPGSLESPVSVETRRESKSALVRRKTGEFFKSR